MAFAFLGVLRDSARQIRRRRVHAVTAQMVGAAGQPLGLERMDDGITSIANGRPEEPDPRSETESSGPRRAAERAE